jgi:hypothetical protein
MLVARTVSTQFPVIISWHGYFPFPCSPDKSAMVIHNLERRGKLASSLMIISMAVMLIMSYSRAQPFHVPTLNERDDFDVAGMDPKVLRYSQKLTFVLLQ